MSLFELLVFSLSITSLVSTNEDSVERKYPHFPNLLSRIPLRPHTKENITNPNGGPTNVRPNNNNSSNGTVPAVYGSNNDSNIINTNGPEILVPCTWEDGSQICPNRTGISPQRCPFEKRNVLSPILQNAGDQCNPTELKCDPDNFYYSIDGSCNNLQFTHWAQTGTTFTRFLPATYADDDCAMRTSINGTALPLAREVRTKIIKSKNINSERFNIFFYGFGQWVDHDVTKMEPMASAELCCQNNKPSPARSPDLCLPTIIPPNDPFYSKFGIECLDLKRAINTKSKGCRNVKPCLPINFATGVFDLSLLYGPEPASTTKLRSFKGGFLKNSFQEDEVFPPIVSGPTECPAGGITPQSASKCTLAADGRVDQNPEIFVIETIFLRIHNYIASTLQKYNPTWHDERVFQEARRILIALYQHVIYAELLPLMLGYQTCSIFKLLPSTSGYSNSYDPKLNPQTILEYSFSAGRTTHSMVTGFIQYLDSHGKPTSYLLRDKYFYQEFMLDKNVFLNIVQSYSTKQCKRQDIYGDDEINNWLFHIPGQDFGMDLGSIDINRGRDAGVPPYNEIRQACGLCKLNNFQEFIDEVADPQDIPTLESLYRDINNVDLYVAGMMEKPVAGSLYGPTLSCILGEAFYRWKIGDRLYYEFPAAKFTTTQLDTIRKVTFAWFLCKGNPTLSYVPQKGFLVPSANQNPLIRCIDIPDIDFNLWKLA